MNTNKIAWLTDTHLNFLKIEARKKFYQRIDQTDSDAILITGDIAEATDVCEILNEFTAHTDKHIYFVLGNHDYYFGSVVSVREKINLLCLENSKLTWLGKPEIINVNMHTVLLGHDGWADARYGNFDHSSVTLNDSRLITELFQAFLLNKSALRNEMGLVSLLRKEQPLILRLSVGRWGLIGGYPEKPHLRCLFHSISYLTNMIVSIPPYSKRNHCNTIIPFCIIFNGVQHEWCQK